MQPSSLKDHEPLETRSPPAATSAVDSIDVVDQSDVSDRPGRPLGHQIVIGTVVQQAGQGVGLVVGLIMMTALARQLSLTEFGVYGLITSFSTYLFFALGSAETAAVRAIAQATDASGRDRAFTTSVVIYAAIGVIAGMLIAAVGEAALGLFKIPSTLETQARIGLIAAAAVTAIGFPMRLFQDLLRASQHFTYAGIAESVGWIFLGSAMLMTLFSLNGPLWLLIAIGSSVPLSLGAAAVIIVKLIRLPYRFRVSELKLEYTRSFLSATGYMLFAASSDIVINSLDRIVLAAFRPPASIALYEGAIKLANLLRAFTGSLSVTLLPVASRLMAFSDLDRSRALLVQGTRYILAAVVPPTIVVMVLADKLLAIWLGQKYAQAAAATIIFLSWWLIAPSSSIASTYIAVEGRFRALSIYSWIIAVINLTLSLLLAPVLGIAGVAIGTTVGYLAVFPFFLSAALRRVDLKLKILAREAWLPAYGTGVALAVGLIIARHFIALNSAGAIVVLAVLGLCLYWIVFAVIWLRPKEREMVRGLLGRRY